MPVLVHWGTSCLGMRSHLGIMQIQLLVLQLRIASSGLDTLRFLDWHIPITTSGSSNGR